jgi:hypothetical protein
MYKLVINFNTSGWWSTCMKSCPSDSKPIRHFFEIKKNKTNYYYAELKQTQKETARKLQTK